MAANYSKRSWRSIATKPDLASALRGVRERLEPLRVQLAKEERVRFKPLLTISGVDDASRAFAEQYARAQFYDAAALEVVVAPEAMFLPHRSVFILPNQSLCDELDYACDLLAVPDVFETSERRWMLNEWYQKQVAIAPVIGGVNLIVHPRWHKNYSHWHLEGISALLDPLLSLHNFDHICVPDLGPAQAESLSNIGIKAQVVEMKGPAYRLKFAVLPTHNLFRTMLHPDIAAGLAKYSADTRRRYAPDASSGPPVYLARLDSTFRPMLNERELCNALVAAGCRVIIASEHDYREQVKLFANASGLISPHGAGLTNMIFLPPGAPVLELRPVHAHGRSPLWDRSFQILSTLLDRPYGVAFFSNEPNTDPWSVDIEEAVAQIRVTFNLN